MKKCVNCCNSIPDAKMRENLTELLGEFTDVLQSLADLSEQAYDQLQEANRSCADAYEPEVWDDEDDFDDEDDDDSECRAEEPPDGKGPKPAAHKPLAKLADDCFEISMSTYEKLDEPFGLMMSATQGPMLVASSWALDYMDKHPAKFGAINMCDDLYICYPNDHVFDEQDIEVITAPVFVFKGAFEVEKLTVKDIVRIVHEMERRKVLITHKDEEPFPVYRK